MRVTPDRGGRWAHRAAALALLAGIAPWASGDWPQFRGPSLDGISTETGLLTEWSADGLETLWSQPLGTGFSGISVAGGKAFTMWGHGGKERLGAFDATTGEPAWQLTLGDDRPDQFGDGPRSTPVVHQGTVYAVGALGVLVAVDAADGTVRWRRDLVQSLGARVPTWGVSAQPLVLDERLIFNVGGRDGHAVVAFALADGSVSWASGTYIPGYSQPIPIDVNGDQQVVVLSGTRLYGLNPATGRVLWQETWKTSYDVNAASPIFLPPDRIFVSTGYDTGAAMYRIVATESGFEAQSLWQTRGMKNQFSSSVYHEGHIYGFDNKTLKCIDVKTGEDVWRQGGLGHGSLFLADGHLVILGEKGALVLAEASAEGFVEKARVQPLEGKHWTVPTLDDGRLYLRNESELLCLRLRAAEAAPAANAAR